MVKPDIAMVLQREKAAVYYGIFGQQGASYHYLPFHGQICEYYGGSEQSYQKTAKKVIRKINKSRGGGFEGEE